MNSKIALITGGSRGLGKNMALRLAEKGYDIILTWQTQAEAANNVVETIKGLGQNAAALELDMADYNSLDQFVERLQALLKNNWSVNTLDCLINNAGGVCLCASVASLGQHHAYASTCSQRQAT